MEIRTHMNEINTSQMISNRTAYFNKAYLVCFLFLGLFPVVPFVAKPFLLAPLVLVSFCRIFYIPLRSIGWKTIALNTGIFLIFLYSCFYSENHVQAEKQILRLLPFFILPFGFAVVPKEIYHRATELFFRVFTIGCGLFSLLVFIYTYWLNSDDIGYIYSHISWNLWGYSEHPIYISLYAGISLIYLLWMSKKSRWDILLFIIILALLLFLTRKGNIISLIVVGGYAIIIQQKSIFNKNLLKISILTIVVLGTILFLFDSYVFTRFQEIFYLSEWKNPISSTGIRNIVLQVCMELSFEQPIFGYGLGDVQDDINTRLVQQGYVALTSVHQYNAHNQYLQIALTSGYLGLILFLGVLVYNYFLLRRSSQKIGMYIFLYILICFVFESLLERQNGVIIAALFLNLFAFKPYYENNDH